MPLQSVSCLIPFFLIGMPKDSPMSCVPSSMPTNFSMCEIRFNRSIFESPCHFFFTSLTENLYCLKYISCRSGLAGFLFVLRCCKISVVVPPDERQLDW